MIKRFQTIVFRIELSKAITTSFLLHGAGKMYFYIKFGFSEKATKIFAICLMAGAPSIWGKTGKTEVLP